MIDKQKYIAGGLSGIIEVIITHPLDYIKTKEHEYVQKGITNKDFYNNIIKKNPINLYQGITPRLIGILPMRCVFWGYGTILIIILEID